MIQNFSIIKQAKLPGLNLDSIGIMHKLQLRLQWTKPTTNFRNDGEPRWRPHYTYFCQWVTYLADLSVIPILRSTLLIKSDGDMLLVIR